MSNGISPGPGYLNPRPKSAGTGCGGIRPMYSNPKNPPTFYHPHVPPQFPTQFPLDFTNHTSFCNLKALFVS